MDDSNNRAGNMQKDESDQLMDGRKSDATSKETVSDVRREEKIPDTERSEEGRFPAPDGTPDPDRSSGRADGTDTGGPI